MPRTPQDRYRPSKRPYIALLVVTAVLLLEYTKQAMLPRNQRPVLWAAELAVAAGLLILRSGWGRDNRWKHVQGELGTIANDFYQPRREALIFAMSLGVAVLGALWWAIATWSVLLNGMRGGTLDRGLLDFEVAAVAGAATGSIVGAVIGLAIGHSWETRHRLRRLKQRSSHA
jgi:hypothetical protein